jgi:hypothetical protein
VHLQGSAQEIGHPHTALFNLVGRGQIDKVG